MNFQFSILSAPLRFLKQIEVSSQTLLLILLAVEVGVLPFFFGGGNPTGRLLVTAIVTLSAVLWLLGNPRLLRVAWWKNPDVVWIVVLVLALFSLATTQVPWNTANELWLLVSGFLLFLAARQLSGERVRAVVAWLIVCVAVPVSLWALYTFVTNTTHELRVFGPLRNADGLGAYLVLPLFAAVGLLREQRRRRWTILLGTCLALFAGTFLLTSSIPALASIVIALIIAAIVYRPRIGKRTVLVALGTLVVLLALSIVARIAITRQTPAFLGLNLAGMRGSLNQRIGFAQSSLSMAQDHPWTGVGLGNWSDSFPRYAVSLLERSSLAHGILFQYVAEGGWPFIIAVLWLLGAVIVTVLANGKMMSPLSQTLAVGTLAMAINGLGDIAWFYPGIALTLWSVAGLLCGRSAVPIIGRTRRFLLYSGVMVATLFVFVWGTTRFLATWLTGQADAAARRHDVIDAFGTAQVAGWFFPSPIEETTLTVMQYVGSTPLNREETRAWAEKTLKHDPIMALSYVIPARLARERGEKTRAEELYREGLRLDPYWTPDLSVDYARFLISENRNAEAERVAVTALDRFGTGVPNEQFSKTQLWEVAGVAALNQGKRVVALKRLEQAVAIDPNNTAATKLLHDAFGK